MDDLSKGYESGREYAEQMYVPVIEDLISNLALALFLLKDCEKVGGNNLIYDILLKDCERSLKRNQDFIEGSVP